MSFLESSISIKRKHSPNENDKRDSSKNKRPKNVGFVSMRDHAKMVAQVALLDEQNQLYQSTWMRKY